jgi:hypothetical protein
MWLKDLGKLLLDVPDCCGLKYLPDTEVDNLQLPILGYNEKVLLICKKYAITLDALNKARNINSSGGGVVITGQSGIGTNFLQVIIILLTSL